MGLTQVSQEASGGLGEAPFAGARVHLWQRCLVFLAGHTCQGLGAGLHQHKRSPRRGGGGAPVPRAVGSVQTACTRTATAGTPVDHFTVPQPPRLSVFLGSA